MSEPFPCGPEATAGQAVGGDAAAAAVVAAAALPLVGRPRWRRKREGVSYVNGGSMGGGEVALAFTHPPPPARQRVSLPPQVRHR